MQEPYKGLRPYEEADKDNFFGREHETWILLDKILTHHLTFLFAASGVGKSSLLQAAIIPELKHPSRQNRGALDVFYWREWAGEAPLQDLQEALVEQFKQQGGVTTEYQEEGDLSLREFLEVFSVFTSEPFVLILDQFEEFFNYHKPFPQRFKSLVSQMVEAFYDRTLPLVFVIAMREDFALELSALKECMPNFLIDNFYRLEKLGLAEAKQAILAPLEKLGFRYEEGLLEQLIQDLTSSEQIERLGQQTLIETAEVVAPPHLQIVCQQLWNLDHEHPQHLLTRKTYDSQGQAQGLLNQHVERHLRTFSAKEKRLASGAFELLVSKRGTKISRPLEELAQVLRVEVHSLERVLDQLDRARILRRQDRQKKIGYELYHDMFAKSVYDWNVRYKNRQRVYRLLQWSGAILLGGSVLFVGYDLRINAMHHHVRLSLKAGISDDLEVYQGQKGSWDLFGQQKFLYETHVLRENIEADKLFQQKHINQLVDIHPNLIDDFPLMERLQAYREAEQWHDIWCLARTGISTVNLSVAKKFITDMQHARSVKGFHLLTELLEKTSDRSLQEALKTALENIPASPSLWSTLLKSPSQKLRHLALLALGERGDTGVVEQLIPLLQDQDSRLRTIKILGNLRERKALPPLIALLKDSDSDVRSRAVQALGTLQAPEAFSPLIASLKDSDSDVRSSAAQALGTLQAQEAIPPLIALLKDFDLDVRSSAVQALGMLQAQEAIPPLIALLKDFNSPVSDNVVQTLGILQAQEVIPPLITWLKDSDSFVRYSAAQTLGVLQVQEAIMPLIVLLKDSGSSVRSSVVQALGTLQAQEAIPPLIALLKDSDSDVRSNAARALGTLEAREAIPPLITSFEDSDSKVRASTAQALGTLQVQEAITPLIALLKDSEWYMRFNAVRALGTLQAQGTITSLIASFKDSDSKVRASAAQALGTLQAPEAIPPLIALLKDLEPYVRANAAQALGMVQAQETIMPLIALLRDSKSEVIDGAVRALETLQAQEAITPLIALLKDSERWNVRYSAVQALGTLQIPEAIPPLIASLKDSESYVRSSAAQALGTLQAQEAIPPLIASLKDSESYVRASAAQALGNFTGKTMVDHLIPLLKSPDWEVRRHLIDGLGKLGYQESVAPLYPLLQDRVPSVRLHAALALIALGQVQAVDTLIKLSDRQTVTLSSSPVADPATVWSSLVKKLLDQPVKIKFAALKLFEEVPHELIDPLLVHLAPLLKENNPNFHHKLAFFFLDRVTGQAHLFPLLQSLFHDDSLSIRLKAFRALGQFKTQEAAKTVLKDELLKEEEKKEWTERLVLDKIILLGKIGHSVGLEFLHAQLQQLEQDKTTWRARRDSEAPVQTSSTAACEATAQVQDEQSKWAHHHWEFPLAYAITQVNIDEGLKLLEHPFAKVREGAWSALARYGDVQMLDRLIALREDQHLGNKTPIVHYAAFRAIDRLLARLELTGTPEDLEHLQKLKQIVQGEALQDRIEWTMGWLAYHVETLRRRAGASAQ